jgi:hypothetical protein
MRRKPMRMPMTERTITSTAMERATACPGLWAAAKHSFPQR